MGRRRALTEQAAEAAIDQACRQLRLPTVRSQVAEVVAAAEREQLSYQGFLAELLLAECDDRERRRSTRRAKAAGFPREKWIADFDFDANPAINPANIHTLTTCAWVKNSFQNDPWSLRRQMIEQARVRKAWWRSARRSQRVRNRRNWCSQPIVRSTGHRWRPKPEPCGMPRRAMIAVMPRAASCRR